MIFELLAVFLTLLGAILIAINLKPKNYPKGPFVFPVLGNLPQMIWHSQVLQRNRKELYHKYQRTYGKVFSMRLGPFPVVVLTDHKLIRDAWNNLQICGRPKLHGAAARTGGVVRGILFQDGEEWHEQRRFALRHLKDFGFGKRSMENLVMDEVTELISGFKRDEGKPISTQTRFNIAVLNSLWAITTGERYSHDDPLLNEIVESIHKSLNFRGLVFFFPWLKDVFPKLSGWEDYMKCMPLSYEFLQKFVVGRLASFEGGEPEHFTDVFINEIRRTTDSNSSFYKERGEATLVATLLDLFVAGIETTSTTLTYTLLYLALFPEKQRKLHEEIDRIVGSRLPTLEDRKNMPYTEAMIQEVLRFSSLVPTGLIHKTLTKVTIGEFEVPKNTWVMANLRGVHHDPEIWEDPENFRPERFLSPNGTEVIKHEALLPFSFGKRVCLGESLARDELFLFITGIFQVFTVQPDPDSPKPTTEQLNSNIIAIPEPHQLVLKERDDEELGVSKYKLVALEAELESVKFTLKNAQANNKLLLADLEEYKSILEETTQNFKREKEDLIGEHEQAMRDLKQEYSYCKIEIKTLHKTCQEQKLAIAKLHLGEEEGGVSPACLPSCDTAGDTPSKASQEHQATIPPAPVTVSGLITATCTFEDNSRRGILKRLEDNCSNDRRRNNVTFEETSNEYFLLSTDSSESESSSEEFIPHGRRHPSV